MGNDGDYHWNHRELINTFINHRGDSNIGHEWGGQEKRPDLQEG